MYYFSCIMLMTVVVKMWLSLLACIPGAQVKYDEYSYIAEKIGTAPRGGADLVLGVGVGYGEGYSLFVQYNLGLTNFQASGYDPAKHSWITVGFRYCPKIFRAEEEMDF